MKNNKSLYNQLTEAEKAISMIPALILSLIGFLLFGLIGGIIGGAIGGGISGFIVSLLSKRKKGNI